MIHSVALLLLVQAVAPAGEEGTTRVPAPAIVLPRPEPPLPLVAGTWWEYRESYTENLRDLDSITDGTTTFRVKGEADSLFLDQKGGADPAPAPIELGDGWMRLGSWTGEDPLPVPLDVGRGRPGSDGRNGWMVEAEETVEVPAGRFAARRCVLRADRIVSRLWIAPGVGIVRETYGEDGRRPEIERLLVRWSGMAPPVPAPSASAAAGATATRTSVRRRP